MSSLARLWPEKTANISRRHQRFPREMTSEKRAQKFHTDDASLPRSGKCFWLDEANFTSRSTNQKHYPDLSSGASSVWNFCSRFSDVSGIAKCRLFLRLAWITFYESLLIGQKTSARCKYKASDSKAWFDMTVFVCQLTGVALFFFIFNSRRARERKFIFFFPHPYPIALAVI